MENNRTYYSMMGLVREDMLESIYQKGAWYRFRNLQDVLEKMEDCEVGNEDKHSIPDVYGRPIQLQITMKNMRNQSDREHTYILSKEILRWRGILTIIALQNFLDLGVKMDIEEYREEGSAFDEALRHAPESDILQNEKSWSSRYFHIVRLKGDERNDYADIAMFSPLTVYFPVPALEDKMPKVEKISWFDFEKKRFVNPVLELSESEKMVVYFWLDYLGKTLVHEGSSDTVQTITYHLTAYKNELRESMDRKENPLRKCFELIQIDQQFKHNSNNSSINQLFNTTVQVYVNLGSLGKIDYKDLFAEQLYYVEKDKNPFERCRFAGMHKVDETNNWYTFIPFGKKVADICNPEVIGNLMDCFEMKAVHKENKVESIQVRLLLSRFSEDNIDAERVYYFNKNEVVRESEDFPVIAMWPPVNMTEWKKYYLYIEGGKNGKIDINLKDMKNGNNRYVHSVEYFPAAVPLQRKQRNNKKVYSIGVIFPNYIEEKEEESANIVASVGIDFGTSGTTVYARINSEEDIFPVTIGKDSPALLTSAENTDQIMMSQYFVVENKEQERFYSIYRRASETLIKEVQPILDGVIYQAHENEMIEESNYFMPDIKWENPNNGAYYEAFIEELCMRIWRELRGRHITSIEWKYALPRSLGNSSSFHAMWNGPIKDFLDHNIQIHHAISKRKYTESEAASIYFLNHNEMEQVNIDKGYMVVDIGGGSTDIAVWQKRQGETKISMLMQTSVPVAGRHLFIGWVAVNLHEISEQVFVNNTELKQELERVRRSCDFKMRNAILERVVNYNNREIMKSYEQDPDWSIRLQRQLEFGVALLFFSLGSLAGYMQQKNVLWISSESGNFSIALGGNGSKILNWLKMDDSYSCLLEMFKEGIKSRRMDNKLYKPRIIRSGNPKKEVACGLVQKERKEFEIIDADLEEEITDEMAIAWNRTFINKYNRLFDRKLSIQEDDIRNLMSKSDRKKDVCNFFMNDMYINYYRDRIIGEW